MEFNEQISALRKKVFCMESWHAHISLQFILIERFFKFFIDFTFTDVC